MRPWLLLVLLSLAGWALPDKAPCAMCVAEGSGSEPKPVVASAEYEGKTYYFDQDSCKTRFMKNPDAFLHTRGNFGPVPAFSLVDTAGKTHTPADYKGKVLVLHLWATWCPACVAETPVFTRLASQGVAVLGLSKDKTEAPLQKFIAERKLNFPSGLAPKPLMESLTTALGPLVAIPTTIVVDKQGKMIYRKVGLVDAGFEKALQEAR